MALTSLDALNRPFSALNEPYARQKVVDAIKEMKREVVEHPGRHVADAYQDLLNRVDECHPREFYLEIKQHPSVPEVHELRARHAFPGDEEFRARVLFVKRELSRASRTPPLSLAEKCELDAWERFHHPRAVELFLKEHPEVGNVPLFREEKIELKAYEDFLPFNKTSTIAALLVTKEVEGYLGFLDKGRLEDLKDKAGAKTEDDGQCKPEMSSRPVVVW